MNTKIYHITDQSQKHLNRSEKRNNMASSPKNCMEINQMGRVKARDSVLQVATKLTKHLYK